MPRRAANLLLVAVIAAGAPAACSGIANGPAAPAGRAAPAAGADSAGDPYTPGDGNGGYDVRHYALNLRITPHATPELAGAVTVTASATMPLSRFDLDLTGLTVSRVTVGGRSAAYRRAGGELEITPPRPIARGERFDVRVDYSGTPKEIDDPLLGGYGWIPTADGVFTGDEPSGARTWFPCDDHPSDKAAFDFTVTVPRGLTAVANGQPAGARTSGGSTTFTWHEPAPMATYLATVDVGRFTVKQGRSPGGIPAYVAVDPAVDTISAGQLLDRTGEITDTWAKLFGPYPFGSTGGVVDNAQVQLSLETQTKPEYTSAMGAMPSTLAHELAHQWFGDSVTITRWSDIWLNEGFATYAEWVWDERTTGPSVQRQFDQRYARADDTALWSVPPAAPGRSQLFGRSVYERGAMTLQALRNKVGDQTFFAILRDWTAQHRHGYGTTAQFEALAQRVSGRPLGPFFQAWLYGTKRPASW